MRPAGSRQAARGPRRSFTSGRIPKSMWPQPERAAPSARASSSSSTAIMATMPATLEAAMRAVWRRDAGGRRGDGEASSPTLCRHASAGPSRRAGDADVSFLLLQQCGRRSCPPRPEGSRRTRGRLADFLTSTNGNGTQGHLLVRSDLVSVLLDRTRCRVLSRHRRDERCAASNDNIVNGCAGGAPTVQNFRE